MLLLFNFLRMNRNEVQSLYVIARNVDIQFCFVCLFVCLFSVANQHADLTHTAYSSLIRIVACTSGLDDIQSGSLREKPAGGQARLTLKSDHSTPASNTAPLY